MIDIEVGADGLDLGTFDTQTFRAANILSVQMGALEYAPDLGIDLRFFLSSEFRFENETFKAYLIQVLASWGINVSSLIDVVENLYHRYTVNLAPGENGSGMIAR